MVRCAPRPPRTITSAPACWWPCTATATSHRRPAAGDSVCAPRVGGRGPGAPVLGAGVRSWFDTGPTGADGAQLDEAVRRLGDLVARIRSGGRRVVVVGYSQGGAVALRLPTAGVAVDAIVVVGAFWADRTDEGPLGRVDGLEVLVAHGSDDDVVPVDLARDAAGLLASLGARVDLAELDGGHEPSDEMLAEASAWIRRHGRRRTRVSLGLPVERVGTDLVTAAGIELARCVLRAPGLRRCLRHRPPGARRALARGRGHHALEPTVALTLAAAATTRLLVHTNVYVLGYRNPFLAAKALASLDVASDGRLIVGVAAGYLRAGVRGARRRLRVTGRSAVGGPRCAGEDLVGRGRRSGGEGWSARGVPSAAGAGADPAPADLGRRQQHCGDPPSRCITVRAGARSHTARGSGALRTAAIEDREQLSARLRRAEELCAELGRSDPLTTCFVPFSLPGYLAAPDEAIGPLAEEVAQLGELGIDWVALMVPGTSRSEVVERAEQLALRCTRADGQARSDDQSARISSTVRVVATPTREFASTASPYSTGTPTTASLATTTR